MTRTAQVRWRKRVNRAWRFGRCNRVTGGGVTSKALLMAHVRGVGDAVATQGARDWARIWGSR